MAIVKESFENVISYENDNSGDVYILSLGTEEFSRKFNVPVRYLDPAPHTSAFEPMAFDIYANLTGKLSYVDSELLVDGEFTIFDGLVKLEGQLHPDTNIIVRIFDNLSIEQIRKLLSRSK